MLLASLPQTALRVLVVPELITVQVLPFQFRMVPLVPTAQTFVAEKAQTPFKLLVTTGGWKTQVFPPSEVLQITPLLPTAQPVVEFSIQILLKSLEHALMRHC